jgi:hypothetical protein
VNKHEVLQYECHGFRFDRGVMFVILVPAMMGALNSLRSPSIISVVQQRA